MKRCLTIALCGLVLSCQGPAAVLAREAKVSSLAGPPVMIQSVVRS